jgi:hypothetical protein
LDRESKIFYFEVEHTLLCPNLLLSITYFLYSRTEFLVNVYWNKTFGFFLNLTELIGCTFTKRTNSLQGLSARSHCRKKYLLDSPCSSVRLSTFISKPPSQTPDGFPWNSILGKTCFNYQLDAQFLYSVIHVLH